MLPLAIEGAYPDQSGAHGHCPSSEHAAIRGLLWPRAVHKARPAAKLLAGPELCANQTQKGPGKVPGLSAFVAGTGFEPVTSGL